MNTCAIVAAVNGCLSGMKCANLVNLSITTKMALYLVEVGNRSMKSRLTVCQEDGGIGNGCNRPGSLTCSGLAL